MAQVAQAQEIPKAIRDHLLLEAELYQAEDSMKIARSQRDKVFRKILKEKGLTKEFHQLRKKLRELRSKDLINNKNARTQYNKVMWEILKIKMAVREEKEYIEANEVLKEKSREFRAKFKELRKDFEVSIKPFYL